jgi:hypothetical protein
MNIIYAGDNIKKKGFSIFLAGPTPRNKEVKSWRPEALEYLKEISYIDNVFVPEHKEILSVDYEYDEQIEWEWKALEVSDIIIFWIPRELKDMPAFTTNVEFGFQMARNPSKCILGAPNDAKKMGYLKYMANHFDVPVFNNLKEMINSIK